MTLNQSLNLFLKNRRKAIRLKVNNIELKEITQLSADAINESIHEEWETDNLTVKVINSSVDKHVEYTIIDDSHKTEFLIDLGKVTLPIYKLHQQMNLENPIHWNTMEFSLQRSGKFEIEFKWDHKIQDDYERDSHI